MKTVLIPMFLLLALWPSAQERPKERINIFLSGRCNDNPTGAIVESSLRESVRASSGYTLVDKAEPGTFLISLACVDAGQEGEGWTAVAYHYGLLMKASPENLGTSLWNPTLGVFTVGRAHAQNKGQELFARFDNDLHQH
jgi:hypothetical protein